jgi:hypothetical protein
MVQLDLSAGTGSVGVFSISVNLTGTALPTDIPLVSLWWDRDRNGFPEHWIDKRIATDTPAPGTPAVLRPVSGGNDPVLVTAGEDVTLLITFDVAPSPSGLVNVGAEIPLDGIELVAVTLDGYAVTPALPFSTSLMSIVPALPDVLYVAPLDLTAPGFALTQGEGSVPLLGLALNVSGAHDVEITNIRVTLLGNVTPADVPTARLYRDLDANGILDPAVDPMVAVSPFVAGPPDVANFSFAGDTPSYLGVYPGQVISLLVAVDIDYAATFGGELGLEISAAGGDVIVRDAFDNVMMTGPDPFGTGLVAIDLFSRPLIVSTAVVVTPTIDGQMGAGEWFSDSIIIGLNVVRGNRVLGEVLFKNNDTFLFVGIDATGDTSRRAFDLAGLIFDAPHDLALTDGADHQFTIGGAPSQAQVTGHAMYNVSSGGWTMEDSPFNTSLPDHAGLEGAAGLGTVSPIVDPHRMYEFAIPLALLGASPGDTVGLAVYSTFPDLLDGDPETYAVGDDRTWNYSAWPLHYRGAPPAPTAWGELCLDPCSMGPNPPELLNGSVQPAVGDPDATFFAWNVTYRDADNDPPLGGAPLVWINKSGTPVGASPHLMTFSSWVGGLGDYTAGAVYSYTDNLTACGSDYTYQFSATDGTSVVFTPPAAGPDVTCANTPPSLLGPGVRPSVGGEFAAFTYNVTYRDAENDAYLDPRVWINESGAPVAGSPFPLGLQNWVGVPLDYVAGANLSLTTTLPLCRGNYTFIFNASDGQVVTFSAPGLGPQVNCAPYLDWTGEPGWTSDGVEPDSAPVGSSFQWRVDYFDADNETPEATHPRTVVWWGPTEVYNVTMWEADTGDLNYTDGKRYVFVGPLTSPGTNYTYCFIANDSFGQSATPLCAAGPNVSAANLPPEVINGQVTPQSQTAAFFDFEYNVTYRDPENQSPAFVWVWVNESGAPIPGSPFQMNFSSFLGPPGNYTVGAVYNRTVQLTCGGSYSFSFQGNDGWNDAFSATSPGPTLTCPPNNPPVLSSPQVTPLSGDTNTVFNYSVVYSDADNDPPLGTPWIAINESGAPFITQTTVLGYWLGGVNDYTAGAVYNFSTTLSTPSTAYTFVFNASDGQDVVYSSEVDAPDVTPGVDGLTVTHTDVAPAVANRGATGVVMMILHLNATPGNVDVVQVNITLTGNATDADVAAVSLWDDLDFSGTNTAGDVLLDSGPVLGGVALLSGFVLTVPGGGGKDLLVEYEIDSVATPDALAGAQLAGAFDVVVTPPDLVSAFGPLSSTNSRINAAPTATGLTVQGFSGGEPGLVHITDHTPVLGWGFADPNAGDTQSEFNVSVWEWPAMTLLWFNSMAGTQNSDTYPGGAPALVDGMDYLLRVRVGDSLGGLWSVAEDLVFTMNALPPPPTEPASPHNATIPGSAAQTVSWTSGGADPNGDAPTTYAWQVALNDPAFGGGSIVASGATTGTASAPFDATVPGDYYWRVNATDGWETTAFGPTWRGYWNFSVEAPPNQAPGLVWTGEPNYVSDGLDPETGFLETTFTYRVSYADPDNDAPAAGFPQVVIEKGGTPILGSPFTMTEWDPLDTNYADGKLYSYAATLAAVGTDYAYRFYAEDVNGAAAGGEATVLTAGPVVVNRPPVLDWTGEVNYVTDGVDPDEGNLSTAFIFRISYTDLDDHAPGEVGLNITQDGTPVLTSMMLEVSPSDVDYTDGKLYAITVSAGLLDIGTYAYHFYATDSEGSLAEGNGTAPTALVVNNRPPLLDWTQETNYVSDGLDPETGDPSTDFVFRISYLDPDNHAPGDGFPQLVILKGGAAIGAPLTMAEVDPSDTDYRDGKLYTYMTTLATGTDYAYYFTAEDALGAAAATVTLDAPDVVTPPGTISIVVLDEDGQPVAGATVTLTDGGTFAFTREDAGTYTFEGLPPGNYTLEVRKAGYETYLSSDPVEVASGDNDPVTVTLQTEAPPPLNLADFWWVFLLVILLLLLLLMLWRRRPAEEEPEGTKAELEAELSKELDELEDALEEMEADDEGYDSEGGGAED